MYPLEKDGSLLLPMAVPTGARQSSTRRKLSTAFCVLLATVCAGVAVYTLAPQCAKAHFSTDVFSSEAQNAELCPQPVPLAPSKGAELWKALNDKYRTGEFLDDAVEWLGGAVRVP